ncbi:unnamed protein product, partial [Ectocarpus fasciculatus]
KRTSSGGDVWVCVDRLCGMSRELVVVCPASNEADPLHISAEFEIDNSSDSFGLGLRRKKKERGLAAPPFASSSLPSLLSPRAAVSPVTARITGTARGTSSSAGSVGVPTAAGVTTPAAAAAATPVAGEAEKKNNKPRPPKKRDNRRTGQAGRRSSEGSYNRRPTSPQREAAAAAATNGGVSGAGGRLSAFASTSAVPLSTIGGVGAATGAAGAGEGGKDSRDRACVRVTVTTEMSYK